MPWPHTLAPQILLWPRVQVDQILLWPRIFPCSSREKFPSGPVPIKMVSVVKDPLRNRAVFMGIRERYIDYGTGCNF